MYNGVIMRPRIQQGHPFSLVSTFLHDNQKLNHELSTNRICPAKSFSLFVRYVGGRLFVYWSLCTYFSLYFAFRKVETEDLADHFLSYLLGDIHMYLHI